MSDRGHDLIQQLGLAPHPEGGHYREVHRAEQRVRRGDDDRSALTVIHFLLRESECSRWHVVESDEVWHFDEGAPLRLITFDPATGVREDVTLGPLESGAVPLHVVPAGVWQAAVADGAYTLVSCAVGPGFEFDDFAFVRDIDGAAPRLEARDHAWL